MLNDKLFGEYIDKYPGKAAFMDKCKQGTEEGDPLYDWVESTFTKHVAEEMTLNWPDIDDDLKNKIIDIF